MLNVIWLWMILLAVVVGGFTGRMEGLTVGAFDTAKTAVMEVALPLVGLMAIWLGMMRLAERAGLVQLLARALRPIMRRIFPEVPADHPAQGAIVLNMAANMLGLGNAATPLGLRAMALLQKLNPHPAAATNAMVTFLTVNTASIQLVPTTAISILSLHGSRRASEIVVPALIASVVALVAGIVVARGLSRLSAFRVQDAEPGEPLQAKVEEDTAVFASPPVLTARGRIVLVSFALCFGFFFFALTWPEVANGVPVWLGVPWRYGDFWADLGAGQRALRALSILAVPFILAFFPLYAWLRRVRVYEEFCEGASESFATAQRIIPFLVGMLVAIRMLREAGIIQMLTAVLQPVLNFIHFPAELLPLAVMRSLSGSASNGLFVDAVKTNGGDSILSLMAATIYGSSETTFYVIAVYFGSVGIRRTRHAVLAGLTADIVAVFTAIAVCRWLLG